MPIGVTVGAPDGAYAEFVNRVPELLIHASPEWGAFVAAVCPFARPIYFVAREGSRAVGVLPAFEMDGPYGRVVNSLPYFGSHGDLIIAPDCERGPVAGALIGALGEHARSRSITALNLVAHPFRTDESELASVSWIARVDDRIGQVSLLPRPGARHNIEQQLLTSCSQKTRNLVRKGIKVGFEIARDDDTTRLAMLHRHHVLGMERIGGTAKPLDHLVRLSELFGPACHIWTAHLEGAFAGGLLTVVYRDWVEYFMPVTVEEHRNRQVSSALIFEAMAGYAAQGFRYWNWGGTWRAQEGVYRFKRGWGAADHPYGYFGYAKMDVLVGASRSELLSGYPYFYVLPFTSLEERRPVSWDAR